jgi:hypothetical protein
MTNRDRDYVTRHDLDAAFDEATRRIGRSINLSALALVVIVLASEPLIDWLL